MENNKKYNVNYVKTAVEMAKFVEEKDTLYGNALFNMIDEYGMNYSLSKITEKLFRLKQLKKLGKEDHSESFLDSLKDLWGYSFLTILYLDQIQNQEEKNEEINEESLYDDTISDLEEDIKEEENDDEISSEFNKIIEESESLLEDYQRSIEEFDNNIKRLKNTLSINENDKSFSYVVADAQDTLRMKMESLKAEYTETLSSLSDKICNLKSIDTNEDDEEDDMEESYSFTGEEYDECKELPEDIEEDEASEEKESNIVGLKVRDGVDERAAMIFLKLITNTIEYKDQLDPFINKTFETKEIKDSNEFDAIIHLATGRLILTKEEPIPEKNIISKSELYDIIKSNLNKHYGINSDVPNIEDYLMNNSILCRFNNIGREVPNKPLYHTLKVKKK